MAKGSITIRIWPSVVATIVGFIAYTMIQNENAFDNSASYALARVERMWWECNNCESDTYLIEYSFTSKDGSYFHEPRQSIPMWLWDDIQDGDAPAIVEYQTDAPDNYRMLGKSNRVFANVVAIIAVGIFVFFTVGSQRGGSSRSQGPGYKASGQGSGKRKRYVPNI